VDECKPLPLTGVQSPASPEEALTKCTPLEEVSGSGIVIVTGLVNVVLGENSTVDALQEGH